MGRSWLGDNRLSVVGRRLPFSNRGLQELAFMEDMAGQPTDKNYKE
jgi:hypothetical protein